MICLDTNILIDVLRNRKNVYPLVKELDSKRDYFTTSINKFELLAGSHFFGERNYQRAKLLLSRFTILDFDKEGIEEAAKIYSNSRMKGKEIPMRDAMIAGIVKTHGKVIFTRDKKHFHEIEGLRIKLIE